MVTMEIIPLKTVGIVGLKNANALIGSQTIVEDLPFSQQNFEEE